MNRNIITNPNFSVEIIGGKTQLFVKDGNNKRRPVTAPSGNGATGNMFHVTYDELVELRDNNKLIPGAKYRIIDYETIVDERGVVKSAGHRFDIIVEALDDHTLSENASVIQSKDGIIRKTIGCQYGNYIRTPEFDDLIDRGMFWCNESNYNIPTEDYLVTYNDDTKVGDEVANYYNGNLYHVEVTYITETTPNYFSGSNLAAWQIKYSLDNHVDMYQIPTLEIGKGTIYYMKDEFGNEAPYDFKNILFDIGGGGESDILGVVGANGLYYEFNGTDTIDCSKKKSGYSVYAFLEDGTRYYTYFITVGNAIFRSNQYGCSDVTTIAEIVYDTSSSSNLKYTFNMDEEGDFSMSGVCTNNIIKLYGLYKGIHLTILDFNYYVDMFTDVTVLPKGEGLNICTIEDDVAPYSYCIGENIIPPYFYDMEMNNNDDNDNDNNNDIGKGGNESK